jgi:hypothetical protein
MGTTDDQFFYDNPNFGMSELNQTQDNISDHANAVKKGRRQKLLNLSQSPTKLSNKELFSQKIKQSQNISKVNPKKKSKKRTKFTLRCDKSKNEGKKMLDFKDIVSVIGIPTSTLQNKLVFPHTNYKNSNQIIKF